MTLSWFCHQLNEVMSIKSHVDAVFENLTLLQTGKLIYKTDIVNCVVTVVYVSPFIL